MAEAYGNLDFSSIIKCWKSLGNDRLGGFKTIDYFIDKKYSRFKKEQTWLLCSGDDIVWVVNDRIDDRYKITNKTKTIYFVRLL